MNKVVKNFLVDCPNLPGVYQMFNQEEEIIYIGKAKNLYKRLSNYINMPISNYKSMRLGSALKKIEIIVTHNEAEAFLLEAKLIKKHKPKYNILLKDDKTFPYIAIKKIHNFPQIAKYRGKRNNENYLYGPFPSSSKVDETLIMLQKAFLLRSCSDNFFNSRKRPCLLYQIKRCSAPCVNKISKESYDKYIKQAQKFLSGKADDLRKEILLEMEEASSKLEYEKAAFLRDRLKTIGLIQTKQFIEMPTIQDADIIAVYSDGALYALTITFIRGGNNLGSKNYYPKVIETAEVVTVVESFMGNFYQKNIPPKEILLNIELNEKEIVEAALYNLHKVKLKIMRPLKGDKKRLVDLVEINAKTALSNLSKRYQQYQDILIRMEHIFRITKNISKIEVYDNSHIFGQNAVGARIMWQNGEFNKNEYKKYNLINKNARGGDDYEMFRQVFFRRFRERKDLDSFFIIDGGKGHLHIINDILSELKINIDFICVSKGRDRNAGNEIIYNKYGEEIVLDNKDQLKHFIQVLRDEAHRFAISSHRVRRSKNLFNSKLDNIPGIGPKKRKKLLSYFGSVAAIQEAGIEALLKVENINSKTAEIIYQYFRK